MVRSIVIKICPTCGSKKINKYHKDLKGQFKGQTYTVPSLEFYQCLDCGEKLYDSNAMRKIEEYSPAFTKEKVDSTV